MVWRHVLPGEGVTPMDNSSLHPMSASQPHLVDLHLWRGPPQNRDADRPVQILVNQGYVAGFSPARLQPVWVAYRVALAGRDVDYDRPIHYHDDLRLPPEHRVGRRTFGKLGNIGLNVGHMAPNEVINRQFGRLAQLETFLMSNMSPQYGSLNGGVWLKLETAIREIRDEPGKDHVWAIVGPVFGDQPAALNRGPGKHLPVPDAYFCITVDPHSYPFDRPNNVKMDCFLIPQDAPPSSNPQDYPATLAEIERRTNLTFFVDWARDIPQALETAAAGPPSRLMLALDAQRMAAPEQSDAVPAAQPDAADIDGLIANLDREAAALQALTRSLSVNEEQRLVTLQHTRSWLMVARGFAAPATPARPPANIITYHIVSDLDDRLKHAARTACNFWNHFLEPGFSVVIRLETFTQAGNTIARAYRPYGQDGVQYGRVEFNTRFLAQFESHDIASTIVHEIGHTLGMGWDSWRTLFDERSGLFGAQAVAQLPALADMRVELRGGPGTALAHWDETLFKFELMSGYKDPGEHVLPVTIDVMELLGHKVIERLEVQRPLADLLQGLSNMMFTRQGEVRSLRLDHFEATDEFETIPHR
jgi:DNA/RNA endonuclease G (NUC1)